jgi:hypothetical protein
VQLTAVALWASKRPQVLAPDARLNHRQSHGRIASDALRALVLFVQHTLPLCWAEAGFYDSMLNVGARNPEDIHFIEWVSVTTLST